MKLNLGSVVFGERPATVAQSGEFKAESFRYSTGVAALKVSNSRGSFTILPFMGQQIWRCDFDGMELAMKSIYDEPKDCRSCFDESYGCFMMHCGLTAMGNPTAEDDHVGHAELPIIRYREAYLEFGKDRLGEYVAVGGTARHDMCFTYNYEFSPRVVLRRGAAKLEISATVKNLKDSPLEYYYLCHVNHRPIDGSRLLYTADPATAIINHEVPDGYRRDWADATNAWLDEFERDPACGDRIGAKGESYKPEIVNCFMHHAAKDGWAYTMQLAPDGTAVYVKHDPKQLPYGTRWIARTVDEDALGMCLPATAEHKGRLYCRAHRQQRMLNTGKTVRYHIETGLLNRSEASAMKKMIAASR